MTIPELDELGQVVERVLAGRVVGDPEAQITTPVQNLIAAVGEAHGLRIHCEPEARVERARPDLAVFKEGLIVGYVELKAPGKGADPAEYTSRHDREQWERLRNLPNLVYTDGIEWCLHQDGERVGLVALNKESHRTSERLRELLGRFFAWDPIVPGSPEELADVLAPLARMLRDDVKAATARSGSALWHLASDWREALFPTADDEQFADAYAQTLTYALLLARLEGSISDDPELSSGRAADSLQSGHRLLSQALRVLTDPAAREELKVSLTLMERTIGAVDHSRLRASSPQEDIWLYFYEQFLAAYDPEMRRKRGVYYTPLEVVRCQVRLVGELLATQFDKSRGFADNEVVTLDPAVGTGTYLLTAIDHTLGKTVQRYGPGAIPAVATELARNLHGFEILVGPYTVAHLRLTQRLRDSGAQLLDGRVPVYLTDTLESPDTRPAYRLPLVLQVLGEEHERARKIKADTRVLVCIGNPPYDRQSFDASEGTDDLETRLERLLGDFIELARGRTRFSHLASLYNTYVYFWRWALWKVFETTRGPGVVSFITASSYLSGPGFLGMREVMRRTFDDLWIIDLEGGNLGARQSENVFDIQTPVAIAIGVRYGGPNPDQPARVRYVRLSGTREEKLSQLDSVNTFDDLPWRECSTEWTAPLVPPGQGAFVTWPLLEDLFPWQTPGVKVGRKWPIATTQDVARRRWRALVTSPRSERARLFPDRRHGRATDTEVRASSIPPPAAHERIIDTTARSPEPPVVRYWYRSFVRHWLIADARLIDLPRPPLWMAHSERQTYMISWLTQVLGRGPAAVASALIPDLDSFRGSFGGKNVIPLWRDQAGTVPNITVGLLERLSATYGETVRPEEFFAYCYAILGCTDYTRRFSEDLEASPPRVPITTDANLFRRGVALGQRLAWLHTYGERFVPEGETAGMLPPGRARAEQPIPASPEDYPSDFSWDENAQTLRVGVGTFAPVSREVWEYEVSGLRPVRAWLGYRMREPSGRHSSPLDDIPPEVWPAEFTEELLQLLWVLEHTVAMSPALTDLLDAVVGGEIFTVEDLPKPTDSEREAGTTAAEVTTTGHSSPENQATFEEL